MAYLCKHCGATFASPADRPRCPSCLRITTVVVTKDAPAPRVAPAPPPDPGPAPTGPARRQPDPRGAPRPARRPFQELNGPPWPLWVGVTILAATLCAVYGTAFDTMDEGERLGAAGTYAALGGAGLALAVRGLLKWRPWR